MVVVCKYLVPKGYQGITLFPFIILRSAESKGDRYLLNHECIHLRQQVELLIVFFYLWYVLDFVWRYFQTKDMKKAYRKNLFEREAYQYEHNLEYLKTRRLYSFLRNRNNV
ncbi:hypothetical protein NJB85_08710 [Myroides odoratimimus]|uniref:hypothetical protein n=1 Tax=Myroides TaxID=76831 RepID=UPI00057F207E|nr:MULTISPECIES: hypothetical protein [Myroides]AJA67916.1 hypothetical protein MYRA21_0728 [Myroides sp. A21]MCO7723260.1 hypothetical protein [Myroides odoratimimus]